MISIDKYVEELTAELKNAFGGRLLYVGLQGSYLRGEANENSDIDIMAVIDNLTVEDLKTYKKAVMTVGDYDKSCGFICGREELKNWNVLEICHLLHTSKDCFGSLKELVPSYSKADVVNYIKMSIGNLYHELCHRYVHADRESNVLYFPQTCKGVFFILQNLQYLKSGTFYSTKKELLEHLDNDMDQAVLSLCIELNSGENADYDFDQAFSLLFDWCKNTLPIYLA